MASKKITALNVYATPLSTDVLPIVDIAGNETKKIKVGDLLIAVSVMPKVYKAYISQVGGGAPTVTEIYNNIGAIVWTRTVQGVYVGTLAGVFTNDKTFIMIGGNSDPTLADIQIDWGTTVNTVDVITYVSGALADSVLTNTAIAIEIYP